MTLDQNIRRFLQGYKNKTISLDQLEMRCSGQVSYSDFAHVISGLLKEEILGPIGKNNLSPKEPRLPYKYRINKPLLNQELSRQIQLAQKTYDTINLSNYYHLSQEHWEEDLAYIRQIHAYLLEHTRLPQEEVLHTELSYQLVGDEKWIETGRGQAILERLNLWEPLKIQKHPDPLMMAIDIEKIESMGTGTTYHHLVVENKSTYYALLKDLPNSMYTTLIYGQGWKITANINQLETQLRGLRGTHQVHYFGDLDYEGIAIWHKLNKVRHVDLAGAFYKALLKQKESHGAKNQKRQEDAMTAFLRHFGKEAESINRLLTKGSYYPQEAIVENDLRELFKDQQAHQG